MKRIKKLCAVFISVLIFISCLTVTSFAAETGTQDGLTAVIQTDKDSYSANEDIHITITVKNTNTFEVKNVSIETFLPEVLTLKDGKLKSETIDLSEGESFTCSAICNVKENVITTPNTPSVGDKSVFISMFMIIIAIAAILATMFIIKQKNSKKIISFVALIVCSAFALSSFATAGFVNTKERKQSSLTIDKTITFDTKELAIQSKVVYDIYNENYSYTVTFNSNGGTLVSNQSVFYGDCAIEPEIPEKDGFYFNGWYDEEGEWFDFSLPVLKNVNLTACWGKVSSNVDDNFEKSLDELLKDREPIGEVNKPMQTLTDSPITSVDVNYELDNAGDVTVREVISDPMLLTAGLIGLPVEIEAWDGNVVNATITFHYDTEKLSVDPSDLAIVWFDEQNNVATLLENSTVDTDNQTVSVSTSHFSKYGVVSKQQWNEAWEMELPPMRTETTPYYNVVLTMDRSGSMSGQKMNQSIQAAQNFIDVLADNDCISIITFDSSAKVIVEQTTLNSDSSSNIRQSIKNQISNISASGGTNIENALKSAMNYVASDSQYQSLIILVSDGQSSVSDETLNKLKNLGQKVVAVGIGNDVDESLMRRIANMTGGSYLYCENAEDIAEAFIELQNAYIGSTKDTDGDGLPDLVEISGMRDQYGEIWRTDPENADSDGDGISDGDEMGTFNATASQTYFSRVSRPDMYTVKSKEAYLIMPETMSYEITDDNKLALTVYVLDAHYRMVPDLLTPMEDDGIPKEYIYSNPQNLKVDLIDVPNEFKLEKIETIAEEKHGFSTSYKTTAIFSFNQTSEWKTVTWKVTADNCSEWSGYSENGIMANYIEKKQTVFPSTAYYQAGEESATNAKMNLARSVKSFLEKLSNSANEREKSLKKENTAALNKVKGLYDSSQDIPDAVYTAIGQAIIEATNASSVDKYDVDQIHNQVASQILGGLKTLDETVVVNGVTYEIEGPIWAMSGVYVSFLNITYPGHSIKLTTTSTQEEVAEALADYCSVLAQLNNDVWKDFISCYISDTFGLMGIKSVTKDNVDTILDKGEVVIKALCDKSYADKLIEEFSGTAKEELSSWFFNKFDDFIEKTIPGGKAFIEASKKFKIAYDSLDKYLTKLDKYIELLNLDVSQEDKDKAKYKKDEAYNKCFAAYLAFADLVNAI